jgi:hypothetical protein
MVSDPVMVIAAEPSGLVNLILIYVPSVTETSHEAQLEPSRFSEENMANYANGKGKTVPVIGREGS